jgi:predicted RNA-binding protein YlqC (UPF0109 family)
MQKRPHRKKKSMEPEEFCKFIVGHIALNTPEPVIGYDFETNEVSVQVAGTDQGRMIGKYGITVAAITVIFWYYGIVKTKDPIVFRLREPDRSADTPPIPFMPKGKPDKLLVQAFLKKVLAETGINKAMVKFCQKKSGDPHAQIYIPEKHREKILDPDYCNALAVLTKTVSRFSGGQIDATIQFFDDTK